MEKRELQEKKSNIVDRGMLSGLDCGEEGWECKACKAYREALPYTDIVISQNNGEVKEVRAEKSGIRK